MIPSNVFANVAHQLPDEEIVELLSARNVRIERIVSTGHASALNEWYDQDRAEWVLLLAGSAGIIFEGETEPLLLEPAAMFTSAPMCVIAWRGPISRCRPSGSRFTINEAGGGDRWQPACRSAIH